MRGLGDGDEEEVRENDEVVRVRGLISDGAVDIECLTSGTGDNEDGGDDEANGVNVEDDDDEERSEVGSSDLLESVEGLESGVESGVDDPLDDRRGDRSAQNSFFDGDRRSVDVD
jgi:hypothetical protein